MKQSRQEALCSQGLLHMHPVDGVCYFPMRADTTPHLQPPHNALLVKATDFLERREDPHGGLAVAVSEQVLRVRDPPSRLLGLLAPCCVHQPRA